MPSPAAAGVIGALVLLAGSLAGDFATEPTASTTAAVIKPNAKVLQTIVAMVLPVLGLAAALLMVSRFRYPHLVNQLIRGKRPFNYIVKLVIVTLAVVVWPFVTLTIFAVGFALSGPVLSLVHRIRDSRRSEQASAEVTPPADE